MTYKSDSEKTTLNKSFSKKSNLGKSISINQISSKSPQQAQSQKNPSNKTAHGWKKVR